MLANLDAAINPDHIVAVEPNPYGPGTSIILSVQVGDAREAHGYAIHEWDMDKTVAEIKYAILREAGTWGRQNW